MLRARLAVSVLLISVTAISMSGSQTVRGSRQWPPGVQKVSADAPVLTPAEAMKTFFIAPGYRLELVAAEPLVQDPIAIDWDPAGRLWVVEMPGFVPNLQVTEPNLDPIGRVVVLEDTNRDGVMDRRTVFADRLMLARSLKVLEHGVLVAEPPNVWLMKDTNGDLRMDAKELVTAAFGRRDAHPEQNANEFYWALDNWMHSSMSDIFLRLKHGRFEVAETLSRGEWGITQDDAGRIYRNTNESALHVDFVPAHYFVRNPHLVRTRGSYEALRDEDNLVNVVWPVRPNPGTNRAYQLGIDRPDGTLARFTAVCAPTVYRGDRLPAETYGNVFVAEPAANLVARLIVEDDGRSLRARKAYERGEFLASTDERFRPVYLSNAPDGTLYVVDMYRGVIQQRRDITEYLRDYIVSHKLEQPIGLGRIYRVVHETTKRDVASIDSKLPASVLVERLSHPNGWWRDTAQRLLVERGDATVAPRLVTLASTAKDWRVRLHALWTLDGLDAIDVKAVTAALKDPARDVRASAIRLAERWLGDATHPIRAPVLERLDDADWSVRYQLAASLGALPIDARAGAIAAFVEKHGDDPIALDAALTGSRGSEVAVLDALMRKDAEALPARDAAVTMFAATVVRSGEEAGLQHVFESIADETRAAWQRTAALRGAEIALLGVEMPGMPRRASQPPAPPCPTCPGARGGPGGAYAFRGPVLTPAGRGGARTVRLAREPATFARFASGAGDLPSRAARVLSRIEWPGKAGASTEVAPLSADDQKRFDAGREIYRNVCQACHQPDGRGMDKVAPSLIESPFAIGPPEVSIRILLHGKEGTAGMMPPVGQTFTDEQVASVLTYVRREWGHASPPVDATLVGTIRAATKERTRPWTNDELGALIK
jgi:mono/diheme cytochrome c family protein/glucose/arabinose dehydrogenase